MEKQLLSQAFIDSSISRQFPTINMSSTYKTEKKIKLPLTFLYTQDFFHLCQSLSYKFTCTRSIKNLQASQTSSKHDCDTWTQFEISWLQAIDQSQDSPFLHY